MSPNEILDYCETCGKPIHYQEQHWSNAATNSRYCLTCGNKQQTCSHEEVTRLTRYDSDGCGYFLSRCNECGFLTHDDLA